MHLHQFLPITGYITQEKYLHGRSLTEIERILGFHHGRLSQGAVVVALVQPPQPHGFELAGYSQVAAHRFGEQFGQTNLDEARMKTFVANNIFAVAGHNRLVKLLPTIRHNAGMTDDEQYPPGSGVPQWKLTLPLLARVVAILDGPGSRYLP